MSIEPVGGRFALFSPVTGKPRFLGAAVVISTESASTTMPSTRRAPLHVALLASVPAGPSSATRPVRSAGARQACRAFRRRTGRAAHGRSCRDFVGPRPEEHLEPRAARPSPWFPRRSRLLSAPTHSRAGCAPAVGCRPGAAGCWPRKITCHVLVPGLAAGLLPLNTAGAARYPLGWGSDRAGAVRARADGRSRPCVFRNCGCTQRGW